MDDFDHSSDVLPFKLRPKSAESNGEAHGDLSESHGELVILRPNEDLGEIAYLRTRSREELSALGIGMDPLAIEAYVLGMSDL